MKVSDIALFLDTRLLLYSGHVTIGAYTYFGMFVACT
jgi:hypothetical protein